MIGTIDTWLLWNLTGGIEGGIYVTDSTNASRTQLMDLATLKWDPFLFSFFELEIRPEDLAKIHSSCEVFGSLQSTLIKVRTYYMGKNI